MSEKTSYFEFDVFILNIINVYTCIIFMSSQIMIGDHNQKIFQFLL